MKFKPFVLHVLFIALCYYYRPINAIIGSGVRPVMANEFPNIVCIALYIPNAPLANRTICTGTIVTPTFMMTAESCFVSAPANQIEIVLSSQNLDNSPCFYPVWWVSYNQWATFHQIAITSQYNDLLIVKVVGPFPNFVPMPISTVDPISQLYGLRGQIVGCGRVNNGNVPTVQHTTDLTVISAQMCNEAWTAVQGLPIQVDPKFICAVGIPPRFFDYGDTGGPLLYFGTVIGINLGVRPELNGEYHPGKINLSLNLHSYSNFFLDLLTEP